MIAVGILVMMAGIIYGATTVTLRAREKARNNAERFQTARVAMGRMVTEIESAYISKHRNMDKYPKTLFIGSDNKLAFTYLGHLRIREGSRESDQGAVSYYLESDRDIPGTQALMRREKVPVDDRPERGGVVQKVAERVKKLRFEYWDPKDQDWRGEWRAELDDLEPVDASGAVDNAEIRAAARAVAAVEDLQEMDSDDEFILPSRVRIQLVLVDARGKEYAFETQARVYMREPLSW